MKKYFKKNLVKLCALATVLCATTTVGAVLASAEDSTETTGKTLSEITYTMLDGASIRADGEAGIRFSALISQDDYDGLVTTYGDDLEFGTFIMAAKYLDSKSGGAFTEEQFFGDYDSDDTTASVYTWEGASITENRTKILQMESSAYLDSTYNAMRVNGSVTKVYDNNLDMDYVGVCYVRAGTEYKLASLQNNVRNVVYVAQLAIEKNEATEFVSAGQSVLDTYTALADAVTSVNYTVNTYLHNYQTGAVEYGETLTYSAELNTTVSVEDIVSSITVDDGTYNYVESRSTTSGVAYIGDKLSLDLYYHKKSGGVLYDFYDKTEATSFYYYDTYGTSEDFDGEEVVSFDRSSSEWGTVTFTDSGIDNMFSVSDIVYIYVYAYVKTPVTDIIGTTRFTYHYYNGTDWSDSSYGTITVNQWNCLRIPIKTDSPSLSGVKFSFQRKPSSGSWQAIGKTDGEELYIGEIGVLTDGTSSAIAYDFSNVERPTDILKMFYVKNTDYKYTLNSDSTYVSDGSFSLKLTATPRWPQYYFTQAFVNWLTVNNVSSISFDVYIDQENSTTTVSSVEGGAGLKNTVNSWYTTSLKTSNITVGTTCAQINKAAANTMSFYIDNLQFTYAS